MDWEADDGRLAFVAMQENKLKRLLAMAKRSIDNSKQELAENDEAIQKLQVELAKSQEARHSWVVDTATRDPRQLLHKVAHGNLLWCLVEYANDNELDDSKDFAWHCFRTEDEIQAYANRASGEPLTLPDFSMTPYEVERVVWLAVCLWCIWNGSSC